MEEEVSDRKLTSLRLDIRSVGSLSERIKNLTGLTKLVLTHTDIRAPPEGIGKLTRLTELDLSENQVQSLPESIGNLTKLRELYLGENELRSLPESIGNLTSLKILGLRQNELQSLPESIGNLTSLTKLNLSINELGSLPDDIGNLTGLTELELGENQLGSLPESIGNLTNLTKLGLGENQLGSLPESIGNLTRLRKLDLNYNQLPSLPESIGGLADLRALSLAGNDLTDLPLSIDKLNLESFSIGENPMAEDIDADDVETSAEFLKKYIEQRRQAKAAMAWQRVRKKMLPPKKEKTPQFVWQEMCLDPGYSAEDLLVYLVQETQLVKGMYGVKVGKEELERYYREKYREMLAERGEGGDPRSRVKRYICLDLFAVYEKYISYVGSEEFKEKCKEETPITGGEYLDVPFGQLVVFEQGGQTYCFTTEEILKFPKGQNPYTRQPLPEELFTVSRLREETFGGWREPAEGEEVLESRLLYSRLWAKLEEVPTYPMSQGTFEGASPAQLAEALEMIRMSPNGGVLSARLDYAEPHLSFVRQSLRLLGDRSMRDSEDDRLLIDQAMKETAGRAEI